MRIRGILSAFVAISVSMLSAGAFAQASYLPTGVQQSVPISTVTGGGWSECFREAYDVDEASEISTVLANCTGDNLMLACSPTGGPTLTVLAQAPRADVTFDTGTGNTTNNANGVEWYFNDDFSWGFAPGGASVSRSSCDTANTSPDERLCLHTNSGFIDNGWRCGSNTGLNSSSAWERVIFSTDVAPAAPPQPIPALPLWVLALLGAGIAAIGGRRLRRWDRG